MGVQTKILKRTEVFDLAEGKKFMSGTGTLIGGTPGQIYDVAYGPVVHTTTLAAAADIGTFIAGQGIIVNAPEYALYGTLRENGKGGALAPSLTLPQGTVVSCMTAGHVWMKRGAFEEIADQANAYIIWQQAKQEGETDADFANDLVVVEINGLLSYGPGSDSTANG